MSNTIKNSQSYIDLIINNSEYWDLTLSNETDPKKIYDGSTFYYDKMISLIDIDETECCSDERVINSLSAYTWNDAINNGLTLKNIGLTGVDNGLITGTTLLEITGSSISIPSGDTRLILHRVTGNTNNYIYPTELVQESGDNYLSLNGGFYQGFFKSGDEYSILPSSFDDEMCFEVVLKPSNPAIILPKTLNDKYPENNGFFLYLGTRSENKFWYEYIKDNVDYEINETGQTSPINENIFTDNNFNIKEQNINQIETDNKYLLFNRTENGYTVGNFNENDNYTLIVNNKENVNMFIDFNRTSTGYTIDNMPNNIIPYDINNDIILNSIGFRLKNIDITGNTYVIGYRMLGEQCDDEKNNLFIEEEYSKTPIILDDITYIHIRFLFNKSKINILFYINGKLIFKSKNLPQFSLKELNDLPEKQEGVPFNISLGGGSQGLCDMIGFDDNFSTRYLLPIEKYFAGTFIGNVYKFKIYYGKMDYTKIYNNYIFGKNFKPAHVPPTIIFNVTNINTIYPETNIKREIGNNISNLDLKIVLNQDRFPLTTYELYFSTNNGQSNLISDGNLNEQGGYVFQNLTHDLTTQSEIIKNAEYRVIVNDTYSDTEYASRKIIKIDYDYMIFYGVSENYPLNSNDVRNLTGKTFSTDTKEIEFHTGVENRIFVFAMPNDRELISAIDKGAWSLDITSAFNEPIIMNIADANNNLTPYKIYILDNAIPYSNDHEIIITLN